MIKSKVVQMVLSGKNCGESPKNTRGRDRQELLLVRGGMECRKTDLPRKKKKSYPQIPPDSFAKSVYLSVKAIYGTL